MNKRTKWWYAWRVIAGLVIGMIGHEAYALDFNIVTAGERGTYIQIGKDLATIIAKPAGTFRIMVLGPSFAPNPPAST